MEEVPDSDHLDPRNGRDVHVGLGIRFLSSTEYNHLFGAYDLVELAVFGYVSFL